MTAPIPAPAPPPVAPAVPPAPAPAPAPIAPVVPAPVAPAPAPAVPGAFDPTTLPPEAQAYLRQQAADAEAKARTTSKANAAKEATDAVMAKIAEALGAPAASDPATLTAQLTEANTRNAQANTQLAVMRVAPALGADPVRLLDSAGFLAAAGQLDARAADYSTQLSNLVITTLAANPWLGAAGAVAAPPPAAAGAVAPGMAAGASDNRPITLEQLKTMSTADIAKAQAEGRLAHLM